MGMDADLVPALEGLPPGALDEDGVLPALSRPAARVPAGGVEVEGVDVECVMERGAVEGEGGMVVVVLGLGLVTLALILLSAGFWLVLTPMILRAGLAQDFAEAFRWDFIRDFVVTMWKELLLCGLFLVVSGWLLVGI